MRTVLSSTRLSKLTCCPGMRWTSLLIFVAAVGLVISCATAPMTPEQMAEDLQRRLIEAQPGDVIEIAEGTIPFTRSLSLKVDGVTLRGAGMDKTILTFKDQSQGAEGLLVNASDFTIEDLAIEDTIGDALKVNEGTNVVIRRVRAEWTNGPDEKNGAYGLYPVQVRNLIVEDCVAIGASDAGIYVGQSDNIVVRRNLAEFNVAGIEIENSVNADVYENEATNNTGGILVFNMPNIPKEGHSTRVFKNKIHSNNTRNFAAPGTAVSSVPAGSGMLVNSNDRVEIFDNDIHDNGTANVIISSYYSTGYEGNYELAEEYDAYPETIYIYGNRFDGGGDEPGTEDLNALRVGLFGEDGVLPDIIWDGFVHPERVEANGDPAAPLAICIDNGDAQLLDVDGPGGYAAPTLDPTWTRCTHEKLSAVDLGSLGAT